MFSIVVAIAHGNCIGYQGKTPWHCPEDLANFKKLTTGGVIIMGRKTYESIGKVLPNRVNIVVSQTMAPTENLLVFNNLWDTVTHCLKTYTKPCFVIGGSEIYEWFWKNGLINTVHITHIFEIVKGDRYFTWPRKNTQLISSTKIPIKTDKYPISQGIHIRYEVHNVKNPEEQQVLELMRGILKSGARRIDRTNVGTISLFGKQLRFNLRNNTFPLLTTRKMFFRGIFEELMLFIRGQTDNQILEEKKISIWRGNTTREFLDSRGLQRLPVGDMGASYGFLFRHFGAEYKTCKDDYTNQGVDQLKNVIDTIRTNPTDRRMIISLWDPTNLLNCPLPPCLYNYQFYVNDGELSCMMTQRSSDFMVAGGWNIATGSLLTYLIATVCDLKPGELIWNIGDVHIYNNLIDQTKIQIERTPVLFPKLLIAKKENITDYTFSDLQLLNYNPQPPIELVMNP